MILIYTHKFLLHHKFRLFLNFSLRVSFFESITDHLALCCLIVYNLYLHNLLIYSPSNRKFPGGSGGKESI